MTALRLPSAVAVAGLLALVAAAPAVARAQPAGGEGGAGGSAAPPKAKTLHVEARALLGEGSLTPGGWGEILVRIANTATSKATGEVLVNASSAKWGGTFDSENHSRAPFAVAPEATISLRIPIRVGEHDDPYLQVFDAAKETVHEQTLRRAGVDQALLVDVSRASALGAALRGMPVAARNAPFGSPYSSRGWGGSTAGMSLSVSSAFYEPTTGDPVMPERTAAYSQVAALLMKSDELSRLSAAEREALVGYVLAGGTLALVVARPEDLRSPILTALVGGEAVAGDVHEATLRKLTVHGTPGGTGPFGAPSAKAVPKADQPEAELLEQLVGHTGGNLQPSLYGSSAPYGLGEVHLLAFDPTRQPAVDSGFAQLRMIDLVRRGTERRSSVLFAPGGYHNSSESIRRQLDPNEGSRWAIVVAALLLCVYAVAAGPLNFSFWRRRGRPLRALLYLCVLSAITFVLVVMTGVLAKGCTGRARHLTVVEAGAGMSQGTARRWRGFFVPSARKLTVSASHASSVVSTARMDLTDESRDQLLVDRDGVRLADLPLRPWQTVVVREDGLADLGEGISLTEGPSGEVVVANHSGRQLRGLILRVPASSQLLWLPHLADGTTATSTSFTPLTGALSTRTTTGGMRLVDFNPKAAWDELERVSSGLCDAWDAVNFTGLGESSWFPDGVPTLLAQIDGGEGRTSDSGLVLSSDRLLVRIVGYGGKP